ncbi:Pancreatic triacylglycerol lipase [Halotydeus destructor]|nr:Pancreatic triacylglycerol lipase [Halotydeus destructor]
MLKFAAIFILTTVPALVSSQENVICYDPFGCFTGSDSAVSGSKNYPQNPEKVITKFILYTRDSSEGQELSYKDVSSLARVSNQPLGVVVHGWGGPNYRETNLKATMLEVVPQVIWVDWKKATSIMFYFRSVINTQLVGRQLAVLLEQLRVHRGVSMDSVHLVGFSLGAHVSGYAGRWLQSQYNQTIGRISALDAASPMFELASGVKTDHHVSKNDAIFVDAIHTSGSPKILKIRLSQLGSRTPFAHVDFYPNGGKDQPQCKGRFWDLTCNHFAAIDYFAFSILHEGHCSYSAVECPTFMAAELGQCSDSLGVSAMGYFAKDQSERGMFYLKTAPKQPFCNI